MKDRLYTDRNCQINTKKYTPKRTIKSVFAYFYDDNVPETDPERAGGKEAVMMEFEKEFKRISEVIKQRKNAKVFLKNTMKKVKRTNKTPKLTKKGQI